jgi:UDP-N-acetylmuramate dehydrogenase
VKAAEVPLRILGGGSNLLVSDAGVRGAVLSVSGGEMSVEGNILRADAGCRKAAVAVLAEQRGLAGLEFFHGIPGLVGGGISMNAGAYGGEIGAVTRNVTACDREGNVREFAAPELDFSYRHSIFRNRRDLTILSAEFKLTPGEPAEIRTRMDDLMNRRREKQPLEYPSAGSTFRRPEGYFAGKLIEDAGLKGFSIGGAAVSEKHAGFVINRGGATANDVRRLVEHIQNTVLHAFGVELKCEIEMW